MADTAAFCIDHLFPKAPVRQFVLTVPMRLRFRMAFSPRLTSAVLRCFIAAVASDLRRRARRLGFRGILKTGAMTVVQRFGSSLALNVHFHTLAVDGVWTTRADGRLDFHPLPAPSDHDVARIARAVCRKVQRMTALGKDDDEQISLLGNLAVSALAGVKINFLDFIALPITIGIGIDDSVNVAARARKDSGTPEAIGATAGAVILCSFTTAVGYGALLLSQNRGIRSFGLSAMVGEITCLVAAILVMPALLASRVQHREVS